VANRTLFNNATRQNGAVKVSGISGVSIDKCRREEEKCKNQNCYQPGLWSESDQRRHNASEHRQNLNTDTFVDST